MNVRTTARIDYKGKQIQTKVCPMGPWHDHQTFIAYVVEWDRNLTFSAPDLQAVKNWIDQQAAKVQV